MNIIIYGSQYGTAKKYAEKLAAKTGFEISGYNSVKDISGYDTIIYIGALYAGGVMGMKKTFAELSQVGNKKIIIATVGLADPTDKSNTDNIRNSMKKQLSMEIFEKALIFHLRGGIDYSKLGFMHKTMMGLLYKKVSRLPEEKKTAEDKAMIATYNQKVDFVDFNALNGIIEKI